jgi:hypothetical protein
MNRIIIGFGILTLLMIRCDSKVTARFEIMNGADFILDSVRIIPNGYESDKYITLGVNEKIEYLVDMSSIAKTDGDYQLNYINEAGLMETLIFGYYTNGYQIESVIRIRIETDTIIFDSEFKKY